MYDELTRQDLQKMQEEIDYRVQVLRPRLILKISSRSGVMMALYGYGIKAWSTMPMMRPVRRCTKLMLKAFSRSITANMSLWMVNTTPLSLISYCVSGESFMGADLMPSSPRCCMTARADGCTLMNNPLSGKAAKH